MAIAFSHHLDLGEVSSSWRGFKSGLWQKQVNVRDFIQQNYEPYEGDDSFLEGATARTDWNDDAERSQTMEYLESARETFRALGPGAPKP